MNEYFNITATLKENRKKTLFLEIENKSLKFKLKTATNVQCEFV